MKLDKKKLRTVNAVEKKEDGPQSIVINKESVSIATIVY
jgi:hypothetical protein